MLIAMMLGCAVPDGVAFPAGGGAPANLHSAPDSTAPDRDGDGVSDADEEALGSDPDDAFSWPADGVWPDRRAAATAAGVAGDTYAQGATFPDFWASDQHSAPVSLYQFYGHVVVLEFGAGWCAPCQQSAAEAEDTWQAVRSDGIVLMNVMIEGFSEEVDLAFLQHWAEAHDLTLPVLGEGEADNTYAALHDAGLNEAQVPYLVVLDREMVLDSVYVGLSEVEDAIARAEVLAKPPL